MKTIFKYPLNVGHNDVRMPATAQVLCVQAQRNVITLWAEVPVANGQGYEPENETRTFVVYGTGRPIPNNPGRYIGTVQQLAGELVWHVYEEKSIAAMLRKELLEEKDHDHQP